MAKIPGGYILLARKITESGIMDKPPLYFKLWVWMLEQANHTNGYKGLKRGQFFTTIEDMREAMSWHVGYRKVTPSRKEIRSAYEWFSRKSDESPTKGHMIDTTKGTHGMLITILNYDFYQNSKNYERHNEGHDEGTTKGHGGAQYKQELKECKNVIPSDFFDLSKRFLEYQKEQLGDMVKISESKIAAGAEVIDKLIRIDGFDMEKQIRPALNWAVKDDFWSTNILSLAGLRKKGSNGEMKFQNLLASFQRSKPKTLKENLVY